MTPGTVILLHSPMTTASAWGALPAALGEHLAGCEVVVPDIADDDRPPYAGRYVARAALEIGAAGPRPPVVLIAHGGAGPLLPAVGAAQRAAHRLVGGYLFVDAQLPGPAGTSRAGRAGQVGGAGTWAGGGAAGAAAEGPEEERRDAARPPGGTPPAGVTVRPRGADFFAEELPMPQDWPDAPCGYLRTSADGDGPARQARLRGWSVAETDTGHYAAAVDPAGTASVLVDLITGL